MSGRGSDSRGSRGRSGSRSSTTPQLRPGSSERSSSTSRVPPELNSRHAAVVRALLESPSAPRPSAPRPSAPPGPSDQQLFPRPSGLFHVPDVRMPHMQRPATPVPATSSGGGSTVPSDPPPDLFFPALVPAIPQTTPEGVPIPIPEDRPRFITVQEAYVYIPFVGMTLQSARVCPKDKEGFSSAKRYDVGFNNI